MTEQLANWSGNVAFAAKTIHTPGTVEELQTIVARSRKAHAVGSRHSFNAIADTDGDLILLRQLNRVLDIDTSASTITVEGGATYRDIARQLDAAGLALPNLASKPHFSIVGACATSTHGSGSANPGLASAISALKIVTASGEIVSLKRGDPDFDGAPVGIGALGIVSEVTLHVVPRFDARQEVWLEFPLMAFIDNFDSVMTSGYSVSAFTSWRGDVVDQVWLKSLSTSPLRDREFHGAKWSERTVDLGPNTAVVDRSELLGITEPWYQRIPHQRMEVESARGAELQAEYFIARSDAPAALRAIHAMQDKFMPLLQISEIRTVARDNYWMSGFYERDSVAIHFAWNPDWPAIQRLLPEVEAVLAPFAPRPHWGKVFTMSATDIRSRYPRFAEFRALADRLDPERKFRNDYLSAIIG
jgi:xylitol oxidase